MQKRSGVITFKGTPLTLVGPDLKEGEKIPAERLTTQEMKEVNFSPTEKTLLLTIPSVDTPVCNAELHAAFKELSKRFPIVVVSRDLPFAQARWCQANQINLTLYSDFKSGAFGKALGVYVDELGLLARAVFLLGADGKILYREIVKEISEQPNFNKIPNL